MIELINCVHTKSFIGLIASLILITTLANCNSTSLPMSNGVDHDKPSFQVAIPQKSCSSNSSSEGQTHQKCLGNEKDTKPSSDSNSTSLTTTTTVNPLESTDSPEKGKERRSKNENQLSETLSTNTAGQRSKIMEDLLSELPNFRFQITPNVEKFNESAYNVSLLATVLRIPNDTPPYKLPPIPVSDKVVKSLLQDICSLKEQKVNNSEITKEKSIEKTTSKPTRETDLNLSTDNKAKVISNLTDEENAERTAEVLKHALDSMSNMTKSTNFPNQTPIPVPETGTSNKTSNNQLPESNDNVNLDQNKTSSTPATNQVRGSLITADQSANQSQSTINPISSTMKSSESIPNEPLKKAPEAKWKPEGIKSGPEYYIIPGSPINRFNYNENEIYDERTRSNQMVEPPVKPISPIVPQNVRSTLNVDQGQGYATTLAPQPIPSLIPERIKIKLHNFPPPPPEPTNPNNQNVNLISTRNTNQQYQIRNPLKPFHYHQYNGQNLGENQYKPGSKYPSGQPIAIEEIVHSQGSRLEQRNQLQIQPDMFVKIIRHYFANALTPEESKVTFVRKAPIVPSQPRPLSSQ